MLNMFKCLIKLETQLFNDNNDHYIQKHIKHKTRVEVRRNQGKQCWNTQRWEI